MGLNTTVLVLNDRLGDIEKDTQLGKLLATAIQTHRSSEPQSPVGNGVYVIETHHADDTAVVLVGGNTARVLTYLKTDSPKDDASIALRLAEWAPLRLLVDAKRSNKVHGKKKGEIDDPPLTEASLEELNAEAKRRGFRLITLRYKGKEPKRLTKKPRKK